MCHCSSGRSRLAYYCRKQAGDGRSQRGRPHSPVSSEEGSIIRPTGQIPSAKSARQMSELDCWHFWHCPPGPWERIYEATSLPILTPKGDCIHEYRVEAADVQAMAY